MVFLNGPQNFSAVSRAILKPVYRFGIPNSNPQTLVSVKINSSKNRQMTVYEHNVPLVPLSVLSYSEYKIVQIFRGFAPGPLGKGLQRLPDSSAARRSFSSQLSSKNRHPKKLLDTELNFIFFKGCLPQILLCPFLNILPQTYVSSF